VITHFVETLCHAVPISLSNDVAKEVLDKEGEGLLEVPSARE
jgi:hypothetical protein